MQIFYIFVTVKITFVQKRPTRGTKFSMIWFPIKFKNETYESFF